MKYIVLDTNVLHNDWNLTGTRLTLLTESAQKLNHQICIPMVVVDELVNQYQTEIQEKANAYNKALKSLSHMRTPLAYSKLDVQKEKDTYKEWMKLELATKKAQILPYPGTKHEFLVLKELRQLKPFLNSEKGYRDALIWETVKEHKKNIGNDILIFISENTNDFANKSKDNFHANLIAELNDEGLDTNTIRYVSETDKYIQAEIKGALDELKDILAQLQKCGGYGNIDFKQVVSDHVTDNEYSDYLSSYPEYDDECFCPGFYESPTISNIDLDKLDFTDVRKLSEESILVTIKVFVSIDLDFFVYHGDLIHFDDPDQYVINYDWNDHFVWAEDHATFEVEYDIVVDKEFKQVISEEGHVQKVSYGSGIEITKN